MIKHYLKNGQQVDSVAGIVVKREEFKSLYKTVESVEKRLRMGIQGKENKTA